MSGPTSLDLLLLVAFALAYPLHGYLTWPRFVGEVRAGRPGARTRAYVETIAVQWVLALALLAHWSARTRPWRLLGLGPPSSGSGPLALALVAAIAAIALVHALGVARVPLRQLAEARGQVGELLAFLPHSTRERGLFVAVAVTAGVCEELFFRGFAPWLLAAWIPPWAAIAVATLLFGLAHGYQGLAGIPRSALLGGALAALTAWAGTLWPAMVLHAVADLHGGSIGGRIARALLSDAPGEEPGARAAAAAPRRWPG